jgi:predicted AAA+ superfamily ATPase
MFKERTLFKAYLEASENFKVVLLTGMRQVGKTTFLEEAAKRQAKAGGVRAMVTLDKPQDEAMAKTEPELFLETYAPPVFIDEIQYAPELFRYIKILVDPQEKKGLIWMTGSRQYNLMAGITESLAGRVAILEMHGFSLYEREDKGAKQQPFLPSKKVPGILTRRNLIDTFRIIWQGSFPAVIDLNPNQRDLFYSSYVRTYIERDVRQLINIGNENAFLKFLRCVAARTGQELNITDIAKDTEIAPNTAKNWLSILETSGIIYLLKPYYRNVIKRLTKRPKLYFMDTGLASWLSQWSSPETLEQGAMGGAFFETFVITEILKSWYHNGRHPSFYYYRDSNRVEIDLLIERDGSYYPVEIKKTANPGKGDIKAFDTFSGIENTGYGSLVCLTDQSRPLTVNANVVSIWDI